MDGERSRNGVDTDLGDPNTSRRIVVDLVDRGKRVLALGDGADELGRVLGERGCEVSTGAGDGPTGSFDIVVLSDVLAQQGDPAAALSDAAARLDPEGRIVATVPNITHGSVRLAVLQGRWRPTEGGLLDADHRRFYDRAGLLALFADAGLVVEELHGTVADPLGVEVVVAADRLPPTMIEWVRQQRDALVYEFVVQARLAQPDETAAPTEVPLVPAAPEESVRRSDRFTERAAAELERRQEQLTVRDHIIGLEAATATAQSRAVRANRQLKVATKRLEKKNARIQELAGQVRALERQLADDPQSGGEGRLSRLRRGREHP